MRHSQRRFYNEPRSWRRTLPAHTLPANKTNKPLALGPKQSGSQATRVCVKNEQLKTRFTQLVCGTQGTASHWKRVAFLNAESVGLCRGTKKIVGVKKNEIKKNSPKNVFQFFI